LVQANKGLAKSLNFEQLEDLKNKAEFEKVKMEIPNASFAMIYNDIYAIVNRNFEIVLYNLESKEQEWVIDTDF
jgi:hypothetical protein